MMLAADFIAGFSAQHGIPGYKFLLDNGLLLNGETKKQFEFDERE